RWLVAARSRVPRGPETKAVSRQPPLWKRQPPAAGCTGAAVAATRKRCSSASRGSGCGPRTPNGLTSTLRPRLRASTAPSAMAALREDFTSHARHGPGQTDQGDEHIDPGGAHVAVHQVVHVDVLGH